MPVGQPAEQLNLGKTDEILELLSNEVVKRLSDAKEIRKMPTDELLTHIEKILSAIKKNNIILTKSFTANIGRINERATQISEHPDRKQLRDSIRKDLKRINRSAIPPA